MIPSRNIQRHGFTLLELAIVLVIIGLIAGGVLVGRDLIRIAQVRMTVKQIESFNTAVNTFKIKYNCLPGDCPVASQFGLDPGSNGDNDGFIGPANGGCPFDAMGCAAIPGSFSEAVDFWYHLSATGLISETYTPSSSGVYQTHVPTGAVTPTVAIQRMHAFRFTAPEMPSSQPGGWAIRSDIGFIENGTLMIPQPHWLMLGSPHSFAITGGYQYLSYAPVDLYNIDNKIDDGLPLAGTVRAQTGGYASIATPVIYQQLTGPGGAGSQYCIGDDASPAYWNVQYSGAPGAVLDTYDQCGLVVKMAF